MRAAQGGDHRFWIAHNECDDLHISRGWLCVHCESKFSSISHKSSTADRYGIAIIVCGRRCNLTDPVAASWECLTQVPAATWRAPPAISPWSHHQQTRLSLSKSTFTFTCTSTELESGPNLLPVLECRTDSVSGRLRPP